MILRANRQVQKENLPVSDTKLVIISLIALFLMAALAVVNTFDLSWVNTVRSYVPLP